MSEIWDKDSLKEYVCSLIDDLDDVSYYFNDMRGRNFLEIEIEEVKE